MLEVGKTYSGKTIVGLDGVWVKYKYGNTFQGECMKETFIRRYVADEAQAYGTDCRNGGTCE